MDFSEIIKPSRVLTKVVVIKVDGSEKIVDDDYSNVSFSDKFVQWVTIVARKWMPSVETSCLSNLQESHDFRVEIGEFDSD